VGSGTSERDPFEIPEVDPFHRGSAGWYLDASTWRVNLICGGCGRHAGVLEHHWIEADGTVHASILCPVTVHGDLCGWHVWGKLLGWAHGEKRPGWPVGDGPGVLS
jgi:hypothetical protein